MSLPFNLQVASLLKLSSVSVQFFAQNKTGKFDLPKSGPLKDLLSRLVSTQSFEAQMGSFQYLPITAVDEYPQLALVGLGKAGDLSAEKLRILGANFWKRMVAEKATAIDLDLDSLKNVSGMGGGLNLQSALTAFLEGFTLASYKFDKYKSKPKAKDTKAPQGTKATTLTVVSKNASLRKQVEVIVKNASATAEAIFISRDWSNEPSNFGTPEYFASEAQRYAKQLGLKCTILTEADCKKENMNLFLAVGAGSDREGRVIILEYTPPKKTKAKTIALVGKGITFDSGGISIKPSSRMEDMKHDMSGASTLFAVTLLAAQRKIPNKLVTVLGFTENMPGGNAVQPGNVIFGRSGKSVEILNTDAEGRLILADLLDIAQDYNPDLVVDAATLTGAASIALGKHSTGVVSNDDRSVNKLIDAGNETYERFWRLPNFKEYADEMKSEVADLRNIVNNTYGGTIRGGVFLQQFIREGNKWIHIDIAPTAYEMGHLAYCPKTGASGLHVRSVTNFIAEV